MEENKTCKNCKYFREFSVKFLSEAKDYDGFCSKRQKYKHVDDKHNCFTPRDK